MMAKPKPNIERVPDIYNLGIGHRENQQYK